MKEFKGTPGKWFVGQFGGVSGDGYFVGAAPKPDGCSYVAEIKKTTYKDVKLIEADANLIAAAPDLLETLDKITKEYIFTRSQLNGDTADELADVLCVKNARAAIARALGEKQ